MELKILSDLYPLMMPYLPGIDAPTLDQHLQMASREFCSMTEAWIEELKLNTVAAQESYTLNPSYDCRIRRVLEVWLKSAADVTAGNDGTLIETGYYTFSTDTGTLKLDAAYSSSVAVTGGLVVKVVLVPQVTQTGTNVLSRDALNRFCDGIRAYALFTLMKMPRQRWTSNDRLTGAPYYFSEYLQKVSDAKSEVAMSNTTEPCGWSG